MNIIETSLTGTEYANEFLLEVNPPANTNIKTWYLTLKETLQRIGIPHYTKPHNKLYQSMYILKKNKKYYLPLFKEMFILDHKANHLTKDDIYRRNSIAYTLFEWKMVVLTNISHDQIAENTPEVSDKSTRSKLFILPYAKKHKWKLIQKYPIGIIKNKKYHQTTKNTTENTTENKLRR